jgi:hypothetical protein
MRTSIFKLRNVTTMELASKLYTLLYSLVSQTADCNCLALLFLSQKSEKAQLTWREMFHIDSILASTAHPADIQILARPSMESS